MRFSLIFLLLLTAFAFAQEKEKLEWNENRPLTWNDFKAEPKESVPYEANTNTGILFSWNYSTESGEPVLKYEVLSNFYPESSWVKNVEETNYLLGHEQLHFDITELNARKLRKAIDEYKPGRNIRKELNQLYEQIEQERVKMQNRFDVETNHSQNKEAEAKWRKFVLEEIKDLEEYID